MDWLKSDRINTIISPRVNKMNNKIHSKLVNQQNVDEPALNRLLTDDFEAKADTGEGEDIDGFLQLEHKLHDAREGPHCRDRNCRPRTKQMSKSINDSTSRI
jgi:hypothetical protein